MVGGVVICFQISTFDSLETTTPHESAVLAELWFAFKLVPLTHWKQLLINEPEPSEVVICFQISTFDSLETTSTVCSTVRIELWFAFKLVPLTHWKQPVEHVAAEIQVVICFQISTFDSLETTVALMAMDAVQLWFAFKLVPLTHWKQQQKNISCKNCSCDLLSN